MLGHCIFMSYISSEAFGAINAFVVFLSGLIGVEQWS
jgi:hypothetical protein